MTDSEVIKYSAITVVVGAVAYFVFRAVQGAAQAGGQAATNANDLLGNVQAAGNAFTDVISHPFRTTYANFIGLDYTDSQTYINTGVLPQQDAALQSIINDTPAGDANGGNVNANNSDNE